MLTVANIWYMVYILHRYKFTDQRTARSRLRSTASVKHDNNYIISTIILLITFYGYRLGIV